MCKSFDKKIIINRNEVSAPLDLSDGKTGGIKMNLTELPWLEFSPLESIKSISILLIIMPLSILIFDSGCLLPLNATYFSISLSVATCWALILRFKGRLMRISEWAICS
jgi:hypothetical protein